MLCRPGSAGGHTDRPGEGFQRQCPNGRTAREPRSSQIVRQRCSGGLGDNHRPAVRSPDIRVQPHPDGTTREQGDSRRRPGSAPSIETGPVRIDLGENRAGTHRRRTEYRQVGRPTSRLPEFQRLAVCECARPERKCDPAIVVSMNGGSVRRDQWRMVRKTRRQEGQSRHDQPNGRFMAPLRRKVFVSEEAAAADPARIHRF